MLRKIGPFICCAVAFMRKVASRSWLRAAGALRGCTAARHAAQEGKERGRPAPVCLFVVFSVQVKPGQPLSWHGT